MAYCNGPPQPKPDFPDPTPEPLSALHYCPVSSPPLTSPPLAHQSAPCPGSGTKFIPPPPRQACIPCMPTAPSLGRGSFLTDSQREFGLTAAGTQTDPPSGSVCNGPAPHSTKAPLGQIENKNKIFPLWWGVFTFATCIQHAADFRAVCGNRQHLCAQKNAFNW